MWQKITNYYNSNAKFHSFVVAAEFAAVSAVTSYNGGLPNSKTGWAALGSAVLGGAWGFVKRWLATNVATQNLTLKQ